MTVDSIKCHFNLLVLHKVFILGSGMGDSLYNSLEVLNFAIWSEKLLFASAAEFFDLSVGVNSLHLEVVGALHRSLDHNVESLLKKSYRYLVQGVAPLRPGDHDALGSSSGFFPDARGRKFRYDFWVDIEVGPAGYRDEADLDVFIFELLFRYTEAIDAGRAGI